MVCKDCRICMTTKEVRFHKIGRTKFYMRRYLQLHCPGCEYLMAIDLPTTRAEERVRTIHAKGKPRIFFEFLELHQAWLRRQQASSARIKDIWAKAEEAYSEGYKDATREVRRIHFSRRLLA